MDSFFLVFDILLPNGATDINYRRTVLTPTKFNKLFSRLPQIDYVEPYDADNVQPLFTYKYGSTVWFYLMDTDTLWITFL